MTKPAKSPTHARARSEAIFRAAEQVLVGGVNSPVRAFRAVSEPPLVIARAAGAHLWDADGNEYVDYLGAWGPMILGHGHPSVIAALRDQAGQGTSFGLTSELEVDLAGRISAALPSIERLRFVSSGTEAAMSAIRLARAFTGRERILMFEGCYHGHADSFLSQAGSGLATLGIPSCPGVPQPLAALTLTAPYNDLSAAEKICAQHGKEIAAVILEPVAANMGVVPPAEGFLAGLRELCTRQGALLIFDEVITGFRVAYGGAQTLFGIAPDLTLLGKIIGGGLPAAAYGGRTDIMKLVAPEGPVYQAGTLAGNPLAMRAGIETLDQLRHAHFYSELNGRAERLAAGCRVALVETRAPAQLNYFGSLLTLFYSREPVRDFAGAKRADTRRFAAFHKQMLERGILLPPSPFEAWFISAAHSDADIARTAEACRDSLVASASADRSP